MTDRELFEKALEAMEHLNRTGDTQVFDLCYAPELIPALKERLAQLGQQEPVATDWERIARVQNAKLMAMCDEAGGFEKLCEVMDKYKKTTPPQRTWVRLTKADQKEIERQSVYVEGAIRMTEAKLKQKNGYA